MVATEGSTAFNMSFSCGVHLRNISRIIVATPTLDADTAREPIRIFKVGE